MTTGHNYKKFLRTEYKTLEDGEVAACYRFYLSHWRKAIKAHDCKFAYLMSLELNLLKGELARRGMHSKRYDNRYDKR